VAPDELAIIDRFFRPLAGEGAFGLRDDAAQLTPPPGCDLVLTADMIAAGVHFFSEDPAATIAQKALRVNLSDLAAKGAQPLGYLLSVGLGSAADEAWLASFVDGLRRDHERFGVSLLGGDTIVVHDGPVISITAVGVVPSGRMVHRFGGKPGDALYVTGTIGAAAVGLALLKGEARPWKGLSDADRAALIGRFREPSPRTALAPALVEFASAAMDVSDGLIGDCDKLAAASGCGAIIEAESVPVPAGLANSDANMLTKLLTGGDDYEILAAISPSNEPDFVDAARRSGVPVTRIGRLTADRGPAEVLWRGGLLGFEQRSYVHGREGNRTGRPRNNPEARGR
jgi:thiamine-monophosphate kinase